MITITWDEWRGSTDGRPTLWIKRLVNWLGCRIDIHKMIASDDLDCYHTHPALAIRVILRGGYVEELYGGQVRAWRPAMIGIVKPEMCHRIHALPNDNPSYSLWIRFRVTHKVELRGDGWKNQEQTHLDPDTIYDDQSQ